VQEALYKCIDTIQYNTIEILPVNTIVGYNALSLAIENSFIDMDHYRNFIQNSCAVYACLLSLRPTRYENSQGSVFESYNSFRANTVCSNCTDWLANCLRLVNAQTLFSRHFHWSHRANAEPNQLSKCHLHILRHKLLYSVSNWWEILFIHYYC